MGKDSLPKQRADLDVIRVETALSRFPVHRLSKTGAVRIDLQEEGERGTTTLKWKVSYNAEYGQPGPLAYKLDTLIVSRKIEEAGKPVPKLIRLGSLRAIAQQLGVGRDTNIIKRAFYQNAFAAITAKIRYKATDGTERGIEIGDTRYAIVFIGENLPDGRVADAVYIVLHDFYREILNNSLMRPLDFDYLRDLPPVPQRWYELASYRMFAALKHDRPRARLSYAEFCTYAPQARYDDFDRVKKQMWKVHAPHRKAGYITGVEFEPTTDRDGRPDWTMIYTPGPKAKAEYRAFTGKGKPVVLEIEPPPARPEPTGLEAELVARGVTRAAAAELVRNFPEDRIRAQIGNLDGRRKVRDPGAWLAGAIRTDFAVKAEPAAPAEPPPAAVAARAEREERARIAAYWEGLTAAERARIDAAALAYADPATRADFAAETRPVLQRMRMVPIRDAYLRTLAIAG